jgi:hypothetical protein
MKFQRSLQAALLAWLCAACGTTAPSRFFTLTALEPTEETGETPAMNLVDSVQVADYLQRPQLIRRNSAVEIEVDEYSRWAEPIDLAFARVLEQDLRVLLGARAASGSRVGCVVTRFEQDIDGQAVLEVTYTLRSADTAQLPRSRSWIARALLSSPADPAALAAALDGLVHDFARALAAQVPQP